MRHNRDIFSIFVHMKVYSVFSLEQPQCKKENHLNYPKFEAMECYSKGLKNEFETAVVNKPSAFEPLKFYCTILIVLYTPGHCSMGNGEVDWLVG